MEGPPDIGGSRTALATRLAEALGIPFEDFKPSIADTNATMLFVPDI